MTDLEQRAAGGELTARHQESLRVVNLASIEEGAGEGYHRGTTHELQRAPASSSNHLKMAVRERPSIVRLVKFRKAYGTRAIDVFRHDWNTWKRALQPYAHKRWTPLQISTVAFFRISFHDDARAQEDWSSVVKRIAPERPVVTEDVGERQKLEEEYIRAQLHVGGHYEVPRVTETFAEDGSVETAQEQVHFEVVQVQHSHSRTHTMDTVEAADDISLTAHLAIEIQPETPWNNPAGDGAATPDRVHVFPDGSPVWVSPLTLVNFKTWSGKLRIYKDIESGPEEGIVTLSHPELARPPYGVLDDRCPTLAVIIHNKAHGWTGVPRQIVHTSTDIGVYDSVEAIKWKPYHQCLAVVGRTMSLTTSMPSRELVAYYKLLLRGVKVEAGQANKDYLILLNQNKRRRNEAVDLLPLADEVPQGNDDGIIVPAPPKAKAKASHSVPSRRPIAGSRPGSSGDGGSTPLPAPPAPVGMPREPHCGGGGLNTDGIIGAAPEPPPPDGIIGGPQHARPSAAQRLPPDWVASLDGCCVAFKHYINPNDGKHYKNWKLWCPRHEQGDPCMKTKGELPKLVAACGPIGPLALLHAWVPMDPAQGRPRNSVTPAMPAIVAYAEAHRAELEEVLERAKAASR